MPIQENIKHVRAGEIIIRQGSSGDAAYILESGRVEIYIEKAGQPPQFIGTRGKGTIIGEMALIDSAPRTATIRAIEDCTMIVITREDFERRIKLSDPVIHVVMQVIMTRYRDMVSRANIVQESFNDNPPEKIEQQFLQDTKTLEGLRLENEFRAAMHNGQLTLNYQPIINLQDGSVRGFEALMRWNHPEHGFISPAVFIPMAEETGLIIEASKWGLKESCRALKRIESHIGLENGFYMSVNFSAQDFAQNTFLEDLYGIISASDVMPQQIQLEITESLLMAQPDAAKNTLDLCQKAGLRIAIDDFGTGYSSLSYLHYYPINTLKIDQSFVRDLIKNKASLELSRSIISLGKNLNMTIIAEGVEHKEEALKLKELGCDYAQGYYFSKPIPEKDVIDILHQYKGFKHLM